MHTHTRAGRGVGGAMRQHQHWPGPASPLPGLPVLGWWRCTGRPGGLLPALTHLPRPGHQLTRGAGSQSLLSGCFKIQSGQYLLDNPGNLGGRPFLPPGSPPFPTRALQGQSRPSPHRRVCGGLVGSHGRLPGPAGRGEGPGPGPAGLVQGTVRAAAGRPGAGASGRASPANPGGRGEQPRGLGRTGGACARPPGLTGPSTCPQLEQGLCCGSVAPLDGPVDALLKCLVQSSGELEVHLASPILYLVEALAGERLLGWGREGQGYGLVQRVLLEPSLS